MIFWTLLVLTILIVACTFASQSWDYYGSPFLMSFVALAICVLVGFFAVTGCGTFIPWNNDVVRTTTYDLKALGTSSSIQGRYFLGGGYVDGKRVLNYITDENGAIHVEQANASRSVVYEDTTHATVIIRHIDHNNGWVTTWPLGSHDEYEFHIPAGSVVDSYTVDNK